MSYQDQFLASGFIQGFPFVNHYRKSISETKGVHIKTDYILQKKDIPADSYGSHFYCQVTKISLPTKEVKIFSTPENALKYANEIF